MSHPMCQFLFFSLHGRIRLSSVDPNSPFSFHLKQNFQHDIVNFWFPGGRLFSITHLRAAYAQQSSWPTVRAQHVCQMNNADFLKAHEFISCCKISCLNVYQLVSVTNSKMSEAYPNRALFFIHIRAVWSADRGGLSYSSTFPQDLRVLNL